MKDADGIIRISEPNSVVEVTGPMTYVKVTGHASIVEVGRLPNQPNSRLLVGEARELGPEIVPCWTERISDGDVQIRLWTGYSWIEFGSEQHLAKTEVKRISESLEYEDD